MSRFWALPVGLLEPLQGQDEQLGVVFVGQRGEGDGGEAPALQPMHRGGVDGHGLLCCDVGAILRTEHMVTVGLTRKIWFTLQLTTDLSPTHPDSY